MADVAAELQPYRSKCVVIPYALDPGQHSVTPAIASRVAALKAEHPEPLVLFVGRLVAYKGVDVLLRAMRDVRARAVIVGDGPLRNELTALAAELDIADRVHFAGNAPADELTALYNACDLFVLPSVTRAEAFGMVQIEAMSCGKPVISTDLPSGVPWVNLHGNTGLIVPPRDSAALAVALRTLLDDAGLRERMGRAGRQRVESEFSIARLVEQTTSLYSSITKQPIRPPAAARRAARSMNTVSSAVLDNNQARTVALPPVVVPLGKRLLDVALSGGGLLVSSPIWLTLAAIIKLEDGGPVFYTQDRVGEGGRVFTVFKFRSMVPNAEAVVGALQATERDPRITRIGRFMRATAMDELPQLWNIFRGDMSFVGPRPLRHGEIEGTDGAFIALEDIPGYAERCRMRPGLTGVAQIFAPRDVGRRNKFRYDRVYARRESFWLDVRLILLSFWITFRGRWESRGDKV